MVAPGQGGSIINSRMKAAQIECTTSKVLNRDVTTNIECGGTASNEDDDRAHVHSGPWKCLSVYVLPEENRWVMWVAQTEHSSDVSPTVLQATDRG
jgi:hypothetical protein